MSDDDFDDLETIPDDVDDGYVKIRKEDLKSVRAAARKRGAAERELADYKRQDAVRAAGIDGLSARQVAVIAREAEADQSAENLRKIAEELGFVQPAPPSEEEQRTDAEIDQQNEAAAVTTGAPPANTRTTLTAQEVAEWPQDKLMRLDRSHPEIYELLLRGESITVPAGFN